MKLQYGANSTYKDITNDVLQKCSSDNYVFIPPTDICRTKFFTDPYVWKHKNIKLLDDNCNIVKIFNENEIVVLSKSLNVISVEKPYIKIWWNEIGKKIEDPKSKLDMLHSYLMIDHGDITKEYPEQLMSIKFINENAKVLELGANIGRNTCVIATILNDDRNLVTMECNDGIVSQLIHNKQKNDFNFHIEPCALSKRKLIYKHWDTMVSDVLLSGYKQCNIISFDELKQKYNIEFDTLVLDCEGAFYQILIDEPDILKNINMIIIENDFRDINHKKFVDDQLFKNEFKLIYSEKGIYDDGVLRPCAEYFYQVFKK